MLFAGKTRKPRTAGRPPERPWRRRLASVLTRPLVEKSKGNGFSLLYMTVVLTLMMAFGLTLVSLTVSSGRLSRNYASNVSAVQIADAGVSKALYCMRNGDPAKCGGQAGDNFVGETNVIFGGGSYTSVLTGVGRERLLTVIATDAAGNKRKIQVEISHNPEGERLQWDFALYADEGGMQLMNNSEVHDGPINSKSDVECGGASLIYDNVYVSKPGGRINMCQIYADAYADNVTNCDMHYNDVYYSQSTSGTTNIGVSYPNSPTPADIDLPSVRLDHWRDSAAAGGVLTGDQTPANGSRLGPIKIEGNVLLKNNVQVTVDGPIWITGNLTMRNNSGFFLNPDYDRNSTVILTDSETDPATFGKMQIDNGATISGSSDERSFLVMVSTNSSMNYSSPAINVSNGAGGSLFLAPNGLIVVLNTSGATTVAGYSVIIEENAIIDFNSAYTNPTDVILADNTVSDWHLRSGTWRELTP